MLLPRCIATGTRKGYTITNCDPFGKVYSRFDGSISIVEMLFCTSLVALVGAGDKLSSSTRRLQIVNTKRQSTICELTFPTTILSVKMNRRRLVVVLEERIYVYDISNMKLLHEIESSPNPNAICALAPSSENSYLAYPSPLPSAAAASSAGSASSPPPPSAAAPSASSSAGSSSRNGDVLLFDAISLSVTNIIQAHKAPLSFVALNSTGTLLSTASEKGTVIRVFGVPNGDKLHEFRRGSYPSRIYSISFNATSTLLGVSSATETVHIFKLAKRGAAASSSSSSSRHLLHSQDGSVSDEAHNGSTSSLSRYDYDSYSSSNTTTTTKQADNSASKKLRRRSLNFGKHIAGSVGGFLPSTVTGIWDPQRDFAFLKLPTAGVRSVVALSSSSPQVMVVTSEGFFYSYAIDLENGGECILQRSYSLIDSSANSSSSAGSHNQQGGAGSTLDSNGSE